MPRQLFSLFKAGRGGIQGAEQTCCCQNSCLVYMTLSTLAHLYYYSVREGEN